MTEPDGDGGPGGAAAGVLIRVLIAEDQTLLRTIVAVAGFVRKSKAPAAENRASS